MPLEVNEIDIRMRVGERADEQKTEKDKSEVEFGCGEPDFDAIVAECTRRVLLRLLAAKER